MVILRNKSGEFQVQNRAGLLDFLRGEAGMRNGEGGVTELAGLECICSVPFAVATAASVQDGENSNAIAWTFSTFDLDRYDERIDPSGWDFKRYLQNPVIQWAHCFDIPAIGKADGVFADEKGLHGSIVFNGKDYDPFGWGIGERVKNGVIRAGSVGFRVLEIELPSKEDSKDGTTLIFRKQELLEFSVCNVPANPWALAKGMTEKKQETSFPDFWGNIIQNHKE
ncbi:HK97 family phage prohead protease [Leadbettera azotonutricia]|uniref:Caudovirus prohead protease n=1 Tax=Leadbettera azotonutricia (strain ATCC BAA-888 / DSM 13862 / ZAS-9) TaxID=545695 RepID=F5Y7L1_LEAAZ|nr:HK97 family phage prohead protease [Leadbettera azotonutricia]AEF83081.1 caudovirus prohead protease [Leadbettera azotonutricia ZAS-9]